MRRRMAGLPQMRRSLTILACFLIGATPGFAHPVPFSYLDLRFQAARIDGTVVAHITDVAHDLRIDSPEKLLQPQFLESQTDRVAGLLGQRLTLAANSRNLVPEWDGIEALPDQQAVRVHVHFPSEAVGVLQIRCRLFPYDPNHQTFLNVYEEGRLTHQSIFDSGRDAFDYYPGTRQGTRAVLARFIPAGIRHILIGPDHILFLIGLLLLGGNLNQLLLIVTSFTVAHSLTLSLAALNILAPPARIIEPAIALSIVYVGADNLLVRNGRDVRAWIALAFGLIHGFGFANVLKEMDLPSRALGWSLFSFNVGVEIGQVCIVAVVAALLAGIRAHSEWIGQRLVVAGSLAVMGAGAFWFVERVFFPGGIS